MTPSEIENQYKDCVDLMRKTVWSFMKQWNINTNEFDDYFSQANVIFMKAADSYNNNLSKFSTWLCNQIKVHLMTKVEKDVRESLKIHKPAEREISLYYCTRPPIDWFADLSSDSKQLIYYVYTGELDIDRILYPNRLTNKLRKTPAIKYVFRFLREKEWSRSRIRTCFKDLEKLLN